jgi:glycosyltransferase involved in cell wall biosynthesis
MRVAVVHSFYSSRQPSGENAQVESEVEALRGAGLKVALISARTDELESGPIYGVRCAIRVATGHGASPLDQIEAFGPDLVHVHNLFPNLSRRWVRRLDVPLVTTLHNFRFICASGSLVREGNGCTACPEGDRWAGLRHRCYRGSLAATLPLTLAQRGGPGADPLLGRADRVLCYSARQRRLLEAGGVPGDRLVDWSNFLPAALDPGVPHPDSAPPREGALYVGRLAAEKGVVDLVRAWTGRDVLRILGDGPHLAEVTRLARRRNVEVLGCVDRRQVLAHMQRSAVLVMPGAFPELAPLTFVEALACGLPVVVRATADFGVHVSTHGLGEVVSGVDEFPAAATRVIADAEAPRRCRAFHEERHRSDTWVARTLALYAEVTGRAPTP